MQDKDPEVRLAKAEAILREALSHKVIPMLPHPYDVPWADGVVIENLEDLLGGERDCCGARAQSGDSYGNRAVPGVAVFTLVSCERGRGHAGPHLASSGHVPFGLEHLIVASCSPCPLDGHPPSLDIGFESRNVEVRAHFGNVMSDTTV